ncbi:MAG: dihydroorotate dehydrogenase electron transfer subunit [Phycisphaerae bacterium]|nr:dihydroorotate dehydrogenase electron transfer subunit [Phycisphaerae bacterium]
MKNKLKRGQYVGRIGGQRSFGVGHRVMTIEFEGEAGSVLGGAVPGQFVQVACRDMDISRVGDPLLRRPFSIAGVRVEPGNFGEVTCLDLVYRVVGPGTRWLERRRVGDLVDVIGPLGNGFTLPEDGKAILLGGGIGFPPMFFLADELSRRGVQKVAFAGTRTVSHIEGSLKPAAIDSADVLEPTMALEEFVRSQTACVITTDDGSCGYGGSIVAALGEFLVRNPDWGDAVLYACGPDGMLKALAGFAAEKGMACQVCMEAYMACGIGVCQSCVVTVKEGTAQKYKMVCANGPVFDAARVVWGS